MVIRHLEQMGTLGLKPDGLLVPLALGTMPVAAGVVGDLLMAARLTLPEVSTEGSRAAAIRSRSTRRCSNEAVCVAKYAS